MRKSGLGFAAVLVSACVAGLYGLQQWGAAIRARAEDRALAQASRWGSLSNLLARRMIEEYGPPQVVGPDRIAWGSQRPWKRIVVYEASVAPLEQVVEYGGPTERLREPVRLPNGARVVARDGELAARSNGEELNRLCLNLADDIAQGRRSPEQARRFYRGAVDLAVSGKSSPYLEHLRFEVPEPVPPRSLGPF